MMSSYARTTSGGMRKVRLIALAVVVAGLFVAGSAAFAQSGKVEKYTIPS